jgi:hypothetical protein|tara:strand:+ start:1669 stop:2217 length:549 start_codon:yes stop_codon:yes gene_type:complete
MTIADKKIINRRHWENLKTTDTRFTKKAGRFTAIDAHWQIMRMTEEFGPVGIGWNWKSDISYTDKLVFASVSIAIATVPYHTKDIDIAGAKWDWIGPMTSVGELYPQARLKGAFDKEACKSVTTDALTKIMSHTGLSADVFMGRFDDNRYVEKLKAEEREASENLKVANSNLVTLEQPTKDK